jgi:2-polyprenyl-3-methyl-5-hydroxy-6-metoxy-1,4-benzoquinol methylase
MNKCVLDFGKEVLLYEDCFNKRVLEVGSRNVNGSLRNHVESLKPMEYIGVDIMPGTGVDKIVDANNLLDFFKNESFDLIISTEMLEHCKDWKNALNSMFSLCKVNGFILLSTRSPGFPYHSYPHDYWRFTTTDIKNIFKNNNIIQNKEDSYAPGVLVKIQKTSENINTEFEIMTMQKNKK